MYDLARQQFLGFNGGGANELRSLFATVGVDNAIGGTNDNISRMVTDLGARLHSGHGDVHNQWAWLYRPLRAHAAADMLTAMLPRAQANRLGPH